MIVKYKDVSYISEVAHARGEGFDEYCYNADGRPCAFLGADGLAEWLYKERKKSKESKEGEK